MTLEERADRQFRAAGRLWNDLGRPIETQAEVAAILRDGHRIRLRSFLAEEVRHARVRAGTCCNRCRADHGRLAFVAEEATAWPTVLPHLGCLVGLCCCDWDAVG